MHCIAYALSVMNKFSLLTSQLYSGGPGKDGLPGTPGTRGDNGKDCTGEGSKGEAGRPGLDGIPGPKVIAKEKNARRCYFVSILNSR